MQRGKVVLPHSYVEGKPWKGDFDIPGAMDGGIRVPLPMPEPVLFQTYILKIIGVWEGTLSAQFPDVSTALEEELQVARDGPAAQLESEESLRAELKLREQLIASKTLESAELASAAARYFGRSPLETTYSERLQKIGKDTSIPRDLTELHAQIYDSYAAAYRLQYQQASLQRLGEQASALEAKLRELSNQRPGAGGNGASIYTLGHINDPSTARVIASSGTFALVDTAVVSLQAAIRAAIAALADYALTVAPGFFVGAVALIWAPKLGNSDLPERFMVGVPLSDLLPEHPQNLSAIAAAGGTLDLPARLGTRSAENALTEVFVAQTDGRVIPAAVPVVAAIHSAETNGYSVTLPGVPPRQLVWTPAVTPPNPSTTLPTEGELPTLYPGAMITPVEGRIDVFPDLPNIGFEDYVIVFPIDSGMTPIYVMFQDRRSVPGVGVGSGTASIEDFHQAAAGAGASVPPQIADQLRGVEFAGWGAYRRQFWKLIALDTGISSTFNMIDRFRMSRGLAPLANESEQVGRRRVLELHHILPLERGGALYDSDNIAILTAKQHIDAHRRKEI